MSLDKTERAAKASELGVEKLNLSLTDPSIVELWASEIISPTLWTVTDPATNPLAVVTDAGVYPGMAVVLFDVEDAENARLIGKANRIRYRVMPTVLSTSFMLKKLVMEFEIYFNDIAQIDQTTAFMGLVKTAAAIRTTNDIVGLGFAANTLVSVTDNAATEEAKTGFGDTLEDTWNKVRIEVQNTNVNFFVNEALVSSHYTPASLPTALMYPTWYFDSLGGGADTFEVYLGAVKIGYVDID